MGASSGRRTFVRRTWIRHPIRLARGSSSDCRSDTGVTLPILNSVDGEAASIHATTVVSEGWGLALTGASGSGKSGLAAQMLAFGAGLVADDLTLLRPGPGGVTAAAPAQGVQGIELRGIGIVPVPLQGPVPLAGIVVLGPSIERLPKTETMEILGFPIPIIRHPARPDLAAKLMIWIRAYAVAKS